MPSLFSSFSKRLRSLQSQTLSRVLRANHRRPDAQTHHIKFSFHVIPHFALFLSPGAFAHSSEKKRRVVLDRCKMF